MGPNPQSEMQQSTGEDEHTAAGDFTSVLATLPPIPQWSSITIESLKSSINSRHAGARWQEESAWTRRLIDVILASEAGWNWQRLKACSNADYFSLPTHIISLLNAVFHTNALEEAKARSEAGYYASPLDLFPAPSGNIGYPIFRLDYSNDEEFALYKKCWDQFLDEEFYLPEAADSDDITWYWVDDKARLDGKDTREVRKLFQSLHATTFPPGTNRLWLFLIVDREAIESMLRVYGPPAVRTSEFIPLSPRKEDAPFLPYVTAASTRWLEDENTSGSTGEALGRVQEEPQVNDTEYHGQFKCALRSVFRLWENEQLLTPQEYYPRDRKIWGGDHVVYEAPGSLL